MLMSLINHKNLDQSFYVGSPLKDSMSLTVDQALVDIIVDNRILSNLTVLLLNLECIHCAYDVQAQNLTSKQPLSLILNTDFKYNLLITDSINQTSCLTGLHPGEHGHYVINVTANVTSTSFQCTVTVLRQPNNIFIPLIVAGVVLLVLFLGCVIVSRFKLFPRLHHKILQYWKERSLNRSLSYELEEPTSQSTKKSKRVLSLDAFRGFALIAMIFVNYGGGSYAQFDHGPWHGITFADLVFPFFVWMMGTSLVISLKNSADKEVKKRSSLFKTFTRTLKLFAIGFILNTRFKVDLSQVRILGVLQRFAIVYGIIATIEILFQRPGQYNRCIQTDTADSKFHVKLKVRLNDILCDIIRFPWQWIVNLMLISIWLLIVYLVPFENCPAGYLGPGGLHEYGKYQGCTGGITGYIDRVIFGEAHLFKSPTCTEVYKCGTYDPENLFGALPTIFLAYLGIQAGRILVLYSSHKDRLIRFFLWSIITISIGVGLTHGTLDSGPMPLNKNLWTLSFSLFTGGLAFAGFSFMYVLIDLTHWWTATPFQYPGLNSILIYMCHAAFATYFPVQWIVDNSHAARLAMALWGCIFWIIMSYIFYRKRFFLVL